MEDCLFCKIANGEIGSDIVYENEKVIAFKDISPKAPVHILVIPKKHISSIMEIGRLNSEELSELMKAISNIAIQFELLTDGFRVVTNTGEGAGQTVDHLHFHILGKRQFGWPPG
ncbi:MAG: histidine triad nucleotide-binding protein [Actinobacteria bacterium]|nr:histidine triad nucleotide-binding protein [Actinomycetota bacterium]